MHNHRWGESTEHALCILLFYSEQGSKAKKTRLFSEKSYKQMVPLISASEEVSFEW